MKSVTIVFFMKNASCIYARVFESRPPSRHFVRKYSAAPRPFILCPPLTKKTYYQPGDTLNFELTLIGESTDYLPYFIYAFIELGKRGIGREKGKKGLVTNIYQKPNIFVTDLL